jgi:phage terminase large subunit
MDFIVVRDVLNVETLFDQFSGIGKIIMHVETEFPEKLSFLFERHRYKIVKGGRYGLKSWNFAAALLMIVAKPDLLWPGRTAPVRVLCARETQKSIAESVHQLLEDQIKRLHLERFYVVQKSEIICKNGGRFAFAGIRQNVNNVKSFEGFDICWVEEGQAVLRNSWNVLIPTIIGRKEGTELWCSYNPDLETDETHQRFAINPPPSAIVVHTTWKDNPWLPQSVIEEEINHLRARSEQDYLNIYEGQCKSAVTGAIYLREIADAETQGRFTRVLYDPTKLVDTFWDLGYGDNTSIWFAQSFPFEFRIIDHLSGSLKGLKWYVEQLQAKQYVYGKHVLPHDGAAHELGSGRTIEEQLRDFYPGKTRIARKVSVVDGIAAVRAIFPKCYFDREKCADGIQSLRHYRYEEDEKLGTYKREPLHDWASHDADAFRTLAVSIKEEARPLPQRAPYRPASSWS